MRSLIPWITALVIVVADRVTKAMLMARIEPGGWVEIMPGFAFTHVHNPGIAFSLFAGGGPLTRVLLHLVIFTSVADTTPRENPGTRGPDGPQIVALRKSRRLLYHNHGDRRASPRVVDSPSSLRH